MFPQIITLFLFLPATILALQCVDESGKPLDWFILYIFPQSSNNPNFKTGLRYATLTSTNPIHWHLSPLNINESDSILARNLNQILPPINVTKNGITPLFYNNQPPDKSDSDTYGHLKGILAGDNKKSGFWLINSVPKLQPGNKSYTYPSNGERNGQIALCISLGTIQLEQIIKNSLHLARPNIYYPETFNTSTPLGLAAKNCKDNNTAKNFPTSSIEIGFSSLGGVKFHSFHRRKGINSSDSQQDDLYSGIVNKALSTSLTVQTYRNKNPQSSYCKIFSQRVENVKVMRFTFENSKEVANFSYTVDHSKWAISGGEESGKNYVCIGDLNRDITKNLRGGGTTCFQNDKVWKAFHELIVDYERCDPAHGGLSEGNGEFEEINLDEVESEKKVESDEKESEKKIESN